MKHPVGLSLCGGALLLACSGGEGRAVELPQTTVAAAATPPGMPPFIRPVSSDWHHIATMRDRDRLRRWRKAWLAAMAKVHMAGNDADVAAQGELFEPDRSLPDATLPAGRYRCRVFKLGANGTATHDFTAYPAFECHVGNEGDVSRLYETVGAQRMIGTLFADNAARQVFLGTMMFGDETAPIAYGRDNARDMAGFVERVGDKRWRLVLPYPTFESILDVVELVPEGTVKP